MQGIIVRDKFGCKASCHSFGIMIRHEIQKIHGLYIIAILNVKYDVFNEADGLIAKALFSDIV